MAAPPAWRESFTLLWTDTDDAALVAINEAIRVYRTDCRDYCDEFRILRSHTDIVNVHNQNKWTQ